MDPNSYHTKEKMCSRGKKTSLIQFRMKLGDSGIGLIELIIALSISAIVGLAVFGTFSVQNRSFKEQEHTSSLQQNLRAAMLLLERDLRTAGYNPSGMEGAKLLVAEDNQIRFSQDLNGNGDFYSGGSTDGREIILYFINENTQRIYVRYHNQVIPQPVAENISALNFQYFDNDGLQLSTPLSTGDLLKVHSIIVSITGVDDHPSLPRPITRTLSSVVYCRNLGNWS